MKTRVLTRDGIRKAAALLLQGEIVVFPTETVYGLGARLFSEAAIAKIYRIKQRPTDNPLIAHIASQEHWEMVAEEIPVVAHRLAQKFWPGPLTIILPKRKNVPDIASAGLPRIGVRMPAHDIARELITHVGEPVVAPSANLSGRPSATHPMHAYEDFQDTISAILDDGPSCIGIESTIVDLFVDGQWRILRPGTIAAPDIERVLRSPPMSFTVDVAGRGPLCPGTKYRHYAPRCPVRLFISSQALEEHVSLHPHLRRIVLANQRVVHSASVYPLEPKSFYARLRDADARSIEEVVVLIDERVMCSEGLYDRVRRAAATHRPEINHNELTLVQ